MKFGVRLGLTGLCIFVFQNCGNFQPNGLNIPYPYSTQPDFFYDVKLISVEVDDLGRQAYEFDVVSSFASNPNQSVSYRVSFSTLDRSGICASEDRTAVGMEKHERFDCLMPTPDDLYIQLTLLGPEGEEAVEQFRF